MKAHHRIAVLCAAATLAATAPATAADAQGFGDKYQLILSADRLVPLFSYTYASTTRTQNNTDLTTSQSGSGISLLWGRNVGAEPAGAIPVNVHTVPRVAFDFTVIPRLTLGAAIAFGFGLGGSIEDESLGPNNVRVSRERDAPNVTAIGLAPRVGYILPLSELFAFWPRGGFGFYWVSARSDTPDPINPNNVTTTSATDNLISLDLDPQFVLTPTEHLFFHAGPLVNVPLAGSRSIETTTGATTASVSNDISLFHFGITAGIGGWISL